jgi:hypothetical protein
LAQDCCGTRCCRFGAGYVICNCGDCPTSEKECSQFCTSFYQNNITSPLPAGCDGNYCDECESCNSDGFGGTKCKLNNSGPCWCNEPRVCQLCSDDGYWYEDEACWPCRAFTKCGEPTGYIHCSPGLNGSLALLKSITVDGKTIYADAPCSECQEPGGLCSSVYEDVSGEYDPDRAIPYTPTGYTTTEAGYFYNPVTNETRYYYETCQDWEPPAACLNACRCNDDCKACTKCDPTTMQCITNPLEPGC